MSSARYAVYFAPAPGSALADFGAAWLGYDVTSGRDIPQPPAAGIEPNRLRDITVEPRRYGLHATLKPPFVLAAGTDSAALDRALAKLAGTIPGFVIPALRLERISGFWALTPVEPCTAIDNLADTCVRALDGFRAPPEPAELARRRQAGLSPRQEELLLRWGYPYVMEQFRFHITLTGRLEGAESDRVGAVLRPLVEPFCTSPLPVDAICLFHQPDRDSRFRLVKRYELASAGPRVSTMTRPAAS